VDDAFDSGMPFTPLFIVFFSSSPNDVNDDDSNVDDGFIIIEFVIASGVVFFPEFSAFLSTPILKSNGSSSSMLFFF